MVKQVIVVRKDLNMGDGKLAAQVSHASQAWAMQTIKALLSGAPHPMCISPQEIEWMDGTYTKVVLAVHSEEELMAIYEKGMRGPAHPPCYLITDLGLTQFKGIPTKTCLALGPDDSEALDKITGHLKLYK